VKKIRYIITIISLLVLACLLSGFTDSVVADDANSYYYDSINVDINVLQNGDMEITEVQKLDYESGDFHYAYRWVPSNRIESIDNVSVSEKDAEYVLNSRVRNWIEERQESGGSPGGDIYAYDVRLDGDDYWIGWWFPETRDMARTFIIKYTVHGGLRISDSGDQIFWKAIFGDRDTYINEAIVTVHLPQSLSADQLEIFSYRAEAESRIIDGKTIEFISADISPDEELEVQVILPHGLVTAQPPAWQHRVESMEAYNRDVKPWVNFLVLLLSIVAVPLAGFIWIRRKLRSAKVNINKDMIPSNVVQPPDDLPPAVVNLLTGNMSAGNAIIATIFDLARRGVLRIEEIQSKGFLGKKKDLLIKKVGSGENNRFERAVTGAISSYDGELLSGNKSALSNLSRKFNRYVEQDAMDRDLFEEEPSRSARRLQVPGIIIAFGSLFIGVSAMIFLFEYVELLFILVFVLFALGFIAAGFSTRMRRFTEKGAMAAANWKAFSVYMKQVMKSNIIADDTVGLWDSYLPYAVVFGITNPWIKRFVQAEAPAPVWFYAWSYSQSPSSTAVSSVGSVPLSAVANAFTSMAHTVGNTFSGGSGSGGTGGGGGGGGGGGSG
jgi:uncharacterized membrane protein YgcG